MFIINACRPSTWCSRQGHLHMGIRVIISFAEVADGYYDVVKCQKEGLICISIPLLPKTFYSSPTLGAKSVTQWGIIPLPPGILGQYQPLVLVSWVQAWVLQAGGEQTTTQIEATSNFITFIDSLNIKHHTWLHTWLQVTSTTHINSKTA